MNKHTGVIISQNQLAGCGFKEFFAIMPFTMPDTSPKVILLTGATDGIGLEAAKMLAAGGHSLLLHGRNARKLEKSAAEVAAAGTRDAIETYRADLSDLEQVVALAKAVSAKHERIDILINNAGVLKADAPILPNGQDIRFVVNVLAPYLLTGLLLPRMNSQSRVVNVSSCAQAPVDMEVLGGNGRALTDMDAYSQSKLAIIMWSNAMAQQGGDRPVFVCIHPGSLLGTKMVREGFNMAGQDMRMGSEIIVKAALAPEFADASGKYFDNDVGKFISPHADALDANKTVQLVAMLEKLLAQ